MAEEDASTLAQAAYERRSLLAGWQPGALVEEEVDLASIRQIQSWHNVMNDPPGWERSSSCTVSMVR